MSCSNLIVVGIFSREDYSSYEWLINRVRSVTGVKDVRNVQITNTWSHFTAEVPKCSFAILYHSKRRGRVNVTDVTDSLYDRELKHLSDIYGKDRVLVVIDDLTNTSEEEKSRILQLQPSIGTLASNLFLYNEEHGDSDERTPLMSPNNKSLETLIRRAASNDGVPRRVIWLIIIIVVGLLIVIIVVSTLPSGHSEYQNVTSVPTLSIITTTYHTPNYTIHLLANATQLPGNSIQLLGNATQLLRNATEL
ncbi:uncharacterized protein LOC134945697 [Pseudophryne corroboree]|uniref:uncharacterized protein LOC134945697 n=1 Tax=Pseudophryne corroboree TaxID=495146 RepID=UPI0030815D32